MRIDSRRAVGESQSCTCAGSPTSGRSPSRLLWQLAMVLRANSIFSAIRRRCGPVPACPIDDLVVLEIVDSRSFRVGNKRSRIDRICRNLTARTIMARHGWTLPRARHSALRKPVSAGRMWHGMPLIPVPALAPVVSRLLAGVGQESLEVSGAKT